MKSLQRRFNNAVKRYPHHSFYICFVKAIQEQGFNRQTISRWFNKLVPEDDYDITEKKDIIKDLIRISDTIKKSREDNQK